MFTSEHLRLERFNVEVAWHSAYQFLSLRGVLAERWAHGPLFGAFRDHGTSIVLTPPDDAPSVPRVAGHYGLKGAGVNWEALDETDQALELVDRWFPDVYEVLKPKRTVLITVNWFVLYPVENPGRASRKLRERFYADHALTDLKWDSFPSYHSAAEMLMVDGPRQASLILGVVGPPHAGNGFFTHADPARDARWWLGLRYTYAWREEEGIEAPIERIHDMIQGSRDEVNRVVNLTFPSVVD